MVFFQKSQESCETMKQENPEENEALPGESFYSNNSHNSSFSIKTHSQKKPKKPFFYFYSSIPSFSVKNFFILPPKNKISFQLEVESGFLQDTVYKSTLAVLFSPLNGFFLKFKGVIYTGGKKT